MPVAAGGAPATGLGTIAIRTNDEDEVALEVSSRVPGGRETRVVYRLARGQSFLECKPVENAGGIRIEAGTRFAVIPDFFGANMVFDPRAYPQSSLIIPPENFVLGLLDGGNTIVMSVWPAADQDAKLTLAGANEDRHIGAMQIGFHGKSVFVAVLHAPGIWHEHRLQGPSADRDIALGWKRPYAAKWRANFCCQRRNDSWDFEDRKTTAWMYLYQEIVWPCWFDGENGLVRLSRRFLDVKGPMEFVLVYPADRKKETPLAVFTPVDIVRNTLGVGPCEYVLDREGLQGRSPNKGRKNFGRGVCDTTTPIEYLFIEGLETRESGAGGSSLGRHPGRHHARFTPGCWNFAASAKNWATWRPGCRTSRRPPDNCSTRPAEFPMKLKPCTRRTSRSSRTRPAPSRPGGGSGNLPRSAIRRTWASARPSHSSCAKLPARSIAWSATIA